MQTSPVRLPAGYEVALILQRLIVRTAVAARTGIAILRVRFRCHRNEAFMLHYAIVFFVIAIIAGVFDFGGIAAGAAGIAKVLFVVFLIGAIITLIAGRSRV